MLRTLTPRRAIWLLALAGTSATWGCKPSLPPQTDVDAARAGLTAALTSWQNNEPATALTQQTPPIYFTDFDQRAGRRLTSFKIEEGHETHGRGICLKAKLTLQGQKEKTRTYLIEIATAIVIVPGG